MLVLAFKADLNLFVNVMGQIYQSLVVPTGTEQGMTSVPHMVDQNVLQL